MFVIKTQLYYKTILKKAKSRHFRVSAQRTGRSSAVTLSTFQFLIPFRQNTISASGFKV